MESGCAARALAARVTAAQRGDCQRPDGSKARRRGAPLQPFARGQQQANGEAHAHIAHAHAAIAPSPIAAAQHAAAGAPAVSQGVAVIPSDAGVPAHAGVAFGQSAAHAQIEGRLARAEVTIRQLRSDGRHKDHAIRLLEMVKQTLMKRLTDYGVLADAEDIVRAPSKLDSSLGGALATGIGAKAEVQLRSVIPAGLMDELRAEGARAETERLTIELTESLGEEAREMAAKEVAEALRQKDAALADAQRSSAALSKELEALRRSAEEAAALLEESRAEARSAVVAEARANAIAEEGRRIADERDELERQLEDARAEAANAQDECARRVRETEAAGTSLAAESERAAADLADERSQWEAKMAAAEHLEAARTEAIAKLEAQLAEEKQGVSALSAKLELAEGESAALRERCDAVSLELEAAYAYDAFRLESGKQQLQLCLRNAHKRKLKRQLKLLQRAASRARTAASAALSRSQGVPGRARQGKGARAGTQTRHGWGGESTARWRATSCEG